MKGEVRNPQTVWLLSIVTCGLYAIYFIYLTGTELKNYLGKEEINPTMDIVLSLLCPFIMWFVILKYGKLIQESQMRAGVADAKDNGILYLLLCYFACGFGYAKIQEDLNKIWQGGGGAPTTF